MIYAVIIIIALALAFVILVRRLPKATEMTGETPPTPPSLPKVTVPSLPKVSLPKFTLPSLPKFSLPKVSLPAKPAAPQANQETIDSPAKDDFWQGADAAVDTPVKPTPVPTPPITPIIEKPVETPAPTKTKGRNVMQEAEDAFAIKDYRKAERLYLRLATEDPKNPKVYGRLGVIYLEQKNYEDARDALQAAIRLEPNVATRHFNLALTYIELGSKAKAIAAMESALKYDPSNRKYRKMLDDILAGRA